MNIISKKKQGVIAIICAIAMVVTSLTIYNPREAKADTSVAVDGKQYSVTVSDGSAWTGFVCQGIFDSARIHFAWGIGVDANSITASINENELKIDGKNANGMFIPLTEVSGLEIGSYEIVVKATTIASESSPAKEIIAKATLKIEKVEGTTELQKPVAPTGLVANINDLKTNYTIAFANVPTATSYKFYLNGTYVKDITNGGVVTIEELKLEEGKTYTFGVSAVNKAGESAISTVEVKVPSKETETTGPEETTEAFDPSTITEWTAVVGSTKMSYYIANDAAGKVSVQPEMHGDNLYAAFKIAAKFKSVVLNDESITPRDGADVEIAKTSFKEGYNKLVVTNFYGNESVTIYFKVEKEEETTTPSYTDGEVLVNESNVTKEVPAYTGGDYWQNEYNNMPVNYVAGKKYVAEVVVSSTSKKKIKMVFQRVGKWDFVDANGGYEAEIAAGNKVKITYVFEAIKDKSTDNGNFDIYLGSVADATTLVFESKKLTTYNEVPAGVKTGVEVLSASATYTVTVDGAPTSVTEGSKYTFGDNAQGYYDATNKVAYAPNTSIKVNGDLNIKSIKLKATMTAGASIRFSTPTGLRFQTVISSENSNTDELKEILENENIIETGTIITTTGILGENGVVNDEFVADDSKTKLNIKNNGWYGGTVGTFCGSIVEIQESNYTTNFVGVGYVTIKYTNDNVKPKTIYTTSDNIRAVATVAQNIKNNQEKKYNDNTMTYFEYLKSLNKGYDTIINTYAAAAKKDNQ